MCCNDLLEFVIIPKNTIKTKSVRSSDLSSPQSVQWKIALSIPAVYWLILPPPAPFPKECQQNYSEANKDINGCSWQLASALCIHYVSFFGFFFFFSSNTQKTAIKPLLYVYDGLRCSATPVFGARGFHGWDSQRSVMNIHVWSAAGKIPGEIERARKMNIELTCWAWERAPLPAPQPRRPVLLVSVWLVNINIYTAVTIRIYRTFSALHVRDT